MRQPKEALVTTASLQIFPDKPPGIRRDAAKFAAGAVLEQKEKRVASGTGKTGEQEKLSEAYGMTCTRLFTC